MHKEPKEPSEKIRILPYNPDLVPLAKKLRKARNLPEVLVWLQLNKQQLTGYNIHRQKIIGNYIVDFYCPACDVVIEIDGDSHNEKEEYDAMRDVYLNGLGLHVIHIKAKDVLERLPNVMKYLRDHVYLRPKKTEGTP